MKTRFMLLLVLATSFSVKAANPTCGITIITHGYQLTGGYLPNWTREMAQAMNNGNGVSLPIYRLRYDKQSAGTTADDIIQLEDGATSIDIAQSGGAIILLDWAAASNETVEYPAQNVADKFFDYIFGQTHNGRSLAEIPIHLIGHSRGCCVNTRLAYLLAGNGVLIDQVTTLDPHPVRPFHVPPGNDWIPETYINVLFADNYYQAESFPAGMPIAGTASQNLSAVLANEFPGSEHQHVHTYYHGTIDLTATSVDGDSIVSAWYQNTLSRDETGYSFSRFKNPLLPRPSSGINQFISGAGGTGSRVSVDSPQQLWSNAGFDQRSKITSVVTVGQTVDIPYYFADRNSAQTITFYTDADTNPFNGFRSQIGSANQNSRPAGSIGTGVFQWTPTTADVGTHFIRIKGANASNARFDYYLKPVTVQATPAAAPSISSVSPSILPPSSSPQLLTILGSNFKAAADPNASKLIFYDPAGNPTPLRTPTYVNSGQLDYSATLPVTGTWKVKVVNGAAESLPYSFTVSSGTVQLTGLSITGPGTISENTSGQFTAKAIFSDGTTPTVTASWSVSSGPASISSSGLLSASSVGANTAVTVTASYTSGGITKTTSANVTIVDTGSGGGYEMQQLIVNGNFANGSSGWTLVGNFQADSRFATCRSCPGYAYLANADGTPGNNLAGILSQTVTIPANALEVGLDYWHRTTTAETGGNMDLLNVRLKLANGSVVGLDDIWNTAANAAYAQRSINLIAYKGQTVTLEFLGLTSPGAPTTFRVDDVSITVTVPTPPTPVSLAISGPSAITEGGSGQYYATMIYSDGSTANVSALVWANNNPAVVTFSPSGLLTAGQVNQDTVVSIYTTANVNGQNYQAFKDVSVLNQPEFTSLAISGPTSMNENSARQFTTTANFSDGSAQAVSATWSVSSGPGSVSSSGLLTVGEVSSDALTTLSARRTIGGVTRSANQDVVVINVPAPVTFSSLSISGPNSVNENDTAQYTATAWFSDGSSQAVNPTWEEDSSVTSISIFGLLSAGVVASDTPVTVSASYTTGGITRSAQKSVTVLNAPDTTGPEVVINFPANNTSVTSSSLTVTGTATDSGRGDNGISAVTVNAVTANGATASGANSAHWSATITLNPGVNTITVVARDMFNNSSQQQVTVNLPTFVNLDFESATIPSSLPDYSEVSVSSALPGWAAYFGAQQLSDIWYNNLALGGVFMSLHDRSSPVGSYVLEGLYSLVLQFGIGGPSGWVGPAIAQTGFIPVETKSLHFFAAGSRFEVTVGGQILPHTLVATAPDYRVYAVDVSSFAGTTSELKFAVLPGLEPWFPFQLVALDNMEFSTTPLPPFGVVTTSASPALAGVAIGGGRYALGQTATLFASADVEFSFVSWTEDGNVVSTNHNYSFEVEGNRNLTANFVANPVLTFGPSALTNTVVQGQSATNQFFEVWNAGGATLYYTNTVSQSWLSVSPTTGSSTGEHDPIKVNFTTATLNVGTYQALITVSSPVGTQQIPVALTVSAPPSPPEIVSWGDNSYGQTNVPPQATNVVAISAGGFHNLALKADGTVMPWGRNTFGQANVPAAAANVMALSAGFFHNLALKPDGSVFGWGEHSLGQTNVPPDATNVVALAAGGNFSLALRADGRVFSWGEDNFGYGKTSVPPAATNVVAIAVGTDHSLALRADGKLVSWGWNNFGQTNVPPAATHVVAIAAGAGHSLALQSDGRVLAWGRNLEGQTIVPTAASNVVAIAAGAFHSLALRADGTVVSWGTNGFGLATIPPTATNVVGIAAGWNHSLVRLGRGAPVITVQPFSRTVAHGEAVSLTVMAVGAQPLAYQWQLHGTNIPGATSSTLVINSAQSQAAGGYTVVVSNSFSSAMSHVATLAVGLPPPPEIVSWGDNSYGQTNVPPQATNVVAISAGGFHNLALRADGGLVGWGRNDSGQASIPSVASNVTTMAAGFLHSLALRADGSIVSWGESSLGQTNVPPEATNVVAIAAGGNFNLALKADGSVVSWGEDNFGKTTVPTTATGVVAVAAGADHSLALRADGRVVSWGWNVSGQTNVPAAATNVVAISAGLQHSLALRADGQVVAWGRNVEGQTNVPSAVTNVVAIAAGAFHSLALRTDGTVVSWGTNGFGLATIPPTATNVMGIAAGWNHSLARLGRGAPVITVQPFSRTVAHGEAVSLTVMAVGAQPLAYQWQLHGTNIPGATSNSYTRANALSQDAGAYSVLVSNSLGSVSSSEANLLVAAPARPALTNPRLTGTTFTLSLPSEAGVNYVLEFKNSLNEANWTVVQTVGGTGGTIDLKDTGATGLSRLYRVRVQ